MKTNSSVFKAFAYSRPAISAVAFYILFIVPKIAVSQAVTNVVTDFGGYWKSSSASPNTIKPNNSHNLLAFTYNGVQYSTGVNDALLASNGETFTAGDFWSLPVNSMTGTIVANTKVGLGALYDGVANGPGTPAPEWGIYSYLTDGIKGLNLGTCIANLPVGSMSFSIHNIRPQSIGDGIPDIVVTQIADPTSGSYDRYEFTDANGVRVGNYKDIIFSNITPLGTWTADFYEATSNPLTLQPGFTQTDRPIRLWAADLSELGITTSNYQQVRFFKTNLCGNSDVAFVAYNNQSVNFVGPLPVRFNFFNGTRLNNAVELAWQTSMEMNSDQFIIERSNDGVRFQPIGTIRSSNQPSAINAYSFTDDQPLNATSYYRIKQVDVNGAFSFSRMVRVDAKQVASGIQLFPNPASDYVTLKHNKVREGATIHLYSASGVLLSIQTIKEGTQQTTIHTNNLSPGLYYISLQDGQIKTMNRLLKN
jgi:hypothetical protein